MAVVTPPATHAMIAYSAGEKTNGLAASMHMRSGLEQAGYRRVKSASIDFLVRRVDLGEIGFRVGAERDERADRGNRDQRRDQAVLDRGRARGVVAQFAQHGSPSRWIARRGLGEQG